MMTVSSQYGVGRVALLVGAAATIAFAASLLSPVAIARQVQGPVTIMGYDLLLIGPFGILDAQFAWFANPCLLIAILTTLRGRRFGGRWLTGALLAVMLVALIEALLWRDYPNDGGPGPLIGHGIGFYLWIAAVLLGMAGLVVSRNSPLSGR